MGIKQESRNKSDAGNFKMEIMNDESIMPFGKHKGKAMIDVPDTWLLWFWGENEQDYKNSDGFALNPDQFEIMKYIEDCFDIKDLV